MSCRQSQLADSRDQFLNHLRWIDAGEQAVVLNVAEHTGISYASVLHERMAEAQITRAGWTAVKCSSFDEMRANHIRNWQAVSPAERLQAAWDLVVDAWEMKKSDPNELRFQRSVTVIRKA